MVKIKLAINFPNTERVWWPPDTKDNFKNHWANHSTRNKLITNNWTENSFTYKYDELGFRNPPGSTPAGAILALGCSYTYGIGLPIEVMWPTLLGHHLQLKVYNAGQPGGSSDTSFRIARELIPKYKPAIVFHLVEFSHRFEIIPKGVPIFSSPTYAHIDNKYVQLSLKINASKYWGTVNQDRNMLAINQLCNNNGIQYITLIEEEYIPHNNDLTLVARDLVHPGPDWQLRVTNKMIDKYSRV